MPPNPAHGEVHVLLADRQNPPRSARLSGVDARQDMQAVAKNRLLKLKRLVGDLKLLALERGVDRVGSILDPHRHYFAVPGMSAVLGATEHPAKLGPLVVLRMLHEGRDGIVNADEAFSAFDEGEEEALNSGSSNSTPTVLLKQIALNCLRFAGRNISGSSLKTASWHRHLTHLLKSVVRQAE